MSGRNFSVIIDRFSLLSIIRTLITAFSLIVSSVSCGKSSLLIVIKNVMSVVALFHGGSRGYMIFTPCVNFGS